MRGDPNLVDLNGGELRVVPRGDALVAEHPAQLEHPLEAACARAGRQEAAAAQRSETPGGPLQRLAVQAQGVAPTMRRFRWSSVAMRSVSERARELWYVTNGRASAPPASV